MLKQHPFIFLFIFLSLLVCASCHQPVKRQSLSEKSQPLKIQPSHSASFKKQNKSRTALYLDSMGLKNIVEADSTIVVRLMYARADNFTGKILYADLKEGYLQENALRSLLRAQRFLRKHHPNYRLIVYDATRPMSIQQKMWDAVAKTNKTIYVSNPAHGGGLHNYGLAVDISILDSVGNPLAMGTKVDYMGAKAHITYEAQMVRKGILTEQEYRNRLLLRSVMRKGGFHPLPTEWWHFNYCNRHVAKAHYRIIP